MSISVMKNHSTFLEPNGTSSTLSSATSCTSSSKYDGYSCKLATRNVEDNIRLIELVKAFPILYDSTLPGYKDTAEKEKTWVHIANIMDWPVELCQTRWKSLRDSFRKRDKKQPVDGSGSQELNLNAQANNNNNSPTWRYGELLSFLRDKNYRRKYSAEAHNLIDQISFEIASSVTKAYCSSSDTFDQQQQGQFSPHDTFDDEHSQQSGGGGGQHQLTITEDVKPDPEQLLTAVVVPPSTTASDSNFVEKNDEGGGDVANLAGQPSGNGSPDPVAINHHRHMSESEADGSNNQQESNVLAALGLASDPGPLTTTTSSGKVACAASNGDGKTTVQSSAVPKVSPKSAQKILQALASSTVNKRKSISIHQRLNGRSPIHAESSYSQKRHRTHTYNSSNSSSTTTTANNQPHYFSQLNSAMGLQHSNNLSDENIRTITNNNNNGNNCNGPNSGSCMTNNSFQDHHHHLHGSNFLRKDFDEDDLFGLSIGASLKKCTEDQKLTAKIEIMRILHMVQHQ